MSAPLGAFVVAMTALAAALSCIGFAATVGPEWFSGPWPWRVLGLAVWLAAGYGAAALCHQIGEGLPYEVDS